MLQYFFQVYFFLIICVIIHANYAISEENAAIEAAPLSDIETGVKCTAEYCTCAEIPKWNGVRCRPGRFSKVPELRFENFKYLPGRMFQGLSISTVYLLDPDVNVAEDVFEGILFLQKLEMKRSSIKVVPDLRFVKDSILIVVFESSYLISLEGRSLQSLSSVTFLSFAKNSIRYIDPDVFRGTDNIEFLNLSHNKLTSIPMKILNRMKNLISFSAHHNELLHVNNLFYVTHPWEIYLSFNNMTNFSLSQLFNLEQTQPYTELDIELDISYNFIKETSSSLSICNIYRDSILNISKLNLNGNEILDLDDCLRCSQLKKLEIIGNKIQFLSEKDFVLVYNTEKILLRENQISRIDADTFKPFNNSLQELDLSSNKITSINGSVKYLFNLEMLNLSHNSIQTLAEDEFTGLYSLYHLYLQHNRIKSLGTAFQKFVKLEVLNVTHNNIELIKPDQVPNTLKYIYLADNPLMCDCKNFIYIDMLKDDMTKGMCLRSEIEHSLQKHLNCPDMCSCKCMKYGHVFSMFVNCSSRNLSLVPHFTEKNLTQLEVNAMFSSDDGRYRVMYQNTDPSLLLKGNVLGISLENNKLHILVEAQLPLDLVQLYLSNNKLRRFPKSVFDSQQKLQQVSLSGNPWKCDCDALELKKWLTSNYHIIKDFDNVRCGISDKGGKNLNGSIIWKLKDVDLCPPIDLVMNLSASFGVLSFVIFCLIAKVIYTIYELNIKVFFYSHGMTFVKEELLDRDKAFDAFISFSHMDDEFVIKDIISEIENRDPNIRLCLHYRHFIPGELITNNIIYAVQNSKRTVLILSRNFLESEWCLLEFKSAHIQTLQDKVHRVIAVKIGELPKEIHPLIKVYLESTTYLTWGESNFWNKLLHILPSQSIDRSHVQRFVADNETKFR